MAVLLSSDGEVMHQCLFCHLGAPLNDFDSIGADQSWYVFCPRCHKEMEPRELHEGMPYVPFGTLLPEQMKPKRQQELFT